MLEAPELVSAASKQGSCPDNGLVSDPTLLTFLREKFTPSQEVLAKGIFQIFHWAQECLFHLLHTKAYLNSLEFHPPVEELSPFCRQRNY